MFDTDVFLNFLHSFDIVDTDDSVDIVTIVKMNGNIERRLRLILKHCKICLLSAG